MNISADEREKRDAGKEMRETRGRSAVKREKRDAETTETTGRGADNREGAVKREKRDEETQRQQGGRSQKGRRDNREERGQQREKRRGAVKREKRDAETTETTGRSADDREKKHDARLRFRLSRPSRLSRLSAPSSSSSSGGSERGLKVSSFSFYRANEKEEDATLCAASGGGRICMLIKIFVYLCFIICRCYFECVVAVAQRPKFEV